VEVFYKVLNLIIIGAAIVFTMIILNFFPTRVALIVFFGVLTGLLVWVRKLDGSKRIMFLLSVSVTSFLITLIFRSAIYNLISPSLVELIIILQLIFFNVIVFPFVANLVAEAKLNKVILVFALLMLLLTIPQITVLSPLRSQGERLDIDHVEEIASEADIRARSLLHEGELNYLSWYTGIAYFLRNSIFGYGLAHINVIGLRGYYNNDTHILILAGAGIFTSIYATEYGKPLLNSLDFKHIVNYTTVPEYKDTRFAVVFGGNLYVSIFYFIFDYPVENKVTVHFNDTWILFEIVSNDGRIIQLSNPLVLRHFINITIVKNETEIYISRIFPDIFYEPISVYINYNPSLDPIETLVFYKYEFTIVLILLWVLEVSREHGVFRKILNYIKDLKEYTPS